MALHLADPLSLIVLFKEAAGLLMRASTSSKAGARWGSSLALLFVFHYLENESNRTYLILRLE